MPRLIIHAGLHKTGTTALQAFLLRHREALAASGVLYPRTGRNDALGGGHHNIAWEAAGDRRFVRNHGTIDRLAFEIYGFGQDAVLSSEDFESCLEAPGLGGLGRLLRHPLLGRWEKTLAIGLRDQASYLESLYTENLNQRSAEPLRPVLETVIAEGAWRLREWVFHFDYLGLWTHLMRHFPGPVVLLDGHAGPGGAAACKAAPEVFMGTFFPGLLEAEARVAPPANPRQPNRAALRRFYEVRAGRPANAEEVLTIERIARGLGEAALGLSAGARARISARFGGDNACLAASAGIAPEGLAIAPGRAGSPRLGMEDIYSAETQRMIASGSGTWVAATSPPPLPHPALLLAAE